MLGKRIASQSEVIRAIVSGYIVHAVGRAPFPFRSWYQTALSAGAVLALSRTCGAGSGGPDKWCERKAIEFGHADVFRDSLSPSSPLPSRAWTCQQLPAARLSPPPPHCGGGGAGSSRGAPLPAGLRGITACLLWLMERQNGRIRTPLSASRSAAVCAWTA